jgi:hypothetical protein
MKKLIGPLAIGGLLVLALLALPAGASAQLPTPRAFVSFLDVRCYRIPDQPPLGVALRLDHLNPYFVDKGIPPEDVVLREPQDLCVPVYKNDLVPPPDVLPFLRFVDWKCYGIDGPSLDLPLHLDHLNPEIVNLFGPADDVIVREPQQLCVPVAKNNSFPPPGDVANLVSNLDVKCYRIESHQEVGGQQIRLTHLNPLFSGLPPEIVTFLGPTPNQLCVPVMKNKVPPPDDVLRIIQYSDVECYDIRGLPLDKQLRLTHLNRVLLDMGLPPEFVKVTDTHKLCVPVAKNGYFPPG